MNVDEMVTNRILAQLDAGQIPWRRNWTTGLPRSLSTGKEFRGVNILLLGMGGFTSRYWVTFREALRRGGQVRPGEQATLAVYWPRRTADALSQREAQPVKSSAGAGAPFVSPVFNLDQVEGIHRPEDDVPPGRPRRLELADQVFEVMPDKPEIVHSVTAEPGYSARLDRVTLPHLSQFAQADAYYSALFQELTRSTGHGRRLNRFQGGAGERIESYSYEALVAELGAAFLCAFAGTANPVSEAQQASVSQGWVQALRKDSRLILRAATAAQRAADYIRGKTHPMVFAQAA